MKFKALSGLTPSCVSALLTPFARNLRSSAEALLVILQSQLRSESDGASSVRACAL